MSVLLTPSTATDVRFVVDSVLRKVASECFVRMMVIIEFCGIVVVAVKVVVAVFIDVVAVVIVVVVLIVVTFVVVTLSVINFVVMSTLFEVEVIVVDIIE